MAGDCHATPVARGGHGRLARMLSLVLLPGLACDAEVWAGLLPALASAHRVHVSLAHFQHDTLPQMAATLLAQHPGEHVLIGCSIGGMLALEVTRQAPQRVRALALLGSSARPDTPELLRLRDEACQHFAQGHINTVLRANVAFAFHPIHATNHVLVARYLAMVRRAGAAGLIRQNRAVMARIDQRPNLPTITCPAWVACGEADRLTPPEHAREMAGLLPNAQLDIIPGCGHMLTLEEPERVAALLGRWLSRL
jgi:pimeloyl-ACP methyl ester carboxylesterase